MSERVSEYVTVDGKSWQCSKCGFGMEMPDDSDLIVRMQAGMHGHNVYGGRDE